ncbi:hypothetical protein MTBLM5_30192 [Magnetospirillum sp. LM-5]|uniref:hypothetical protein n=1 Tax=Magnetospirillum sp. LM-5 TaxID=2681466 RepID=UPI00137FFAFA|nr:hypothetical protein [Magnetospirillum sp. LM-5]CAA7619532.1 hypothetical protein MTBLM5_30192 [Magnetospirillum sp. LM-5]
MAQSNEYIADGNTRLFAFRFPAFEQSDLSVSLNGTPQLTGWSALGLGGGNGGAIEFVSAPTSGQVVLIARNKIPPQVAYLVQDENLADLQDKAVARVNLGVYSTSQTDAAINTAAGAVTTSSLQKAANLSDVADVATARANLGVPAAADTYTKTQTDAAIGSAAGAVTASSLQKAANLSDVADAAQARANLGVPAAADTYTKTQTDAAIGSAAGAVTASSLQKAANLSDVADAAQARANLGVPDAADTYTKTQTDAAIGSAAGAVTASSLQKAANLSDVADAAQARANLGVPAAADTYTKTQTDAAIGSAAGAVTASSLQKAANLSDVADAAQARANLGVPAAADTDTKTQTDAAIGSAAGAVTASSLQKAANLSDVADVATARANLGVPAVSHDHPASAIVSGTIDTARLGSGTASNGTYLRGDQTWAAISTGTWSFVASSAMNNATTVDFTGLAPGYDYQMVISDYYAPYGSSLGLYLGTGASPTWHTSPNYAYANVSAWTDGSNNGGGQGGNTVGWSIPCGACQNSNASSSTGGGYAVVELYAPDTNGTYKTFSFHGFGIYGASTQYTSFSSGAGRHNVTTGPVTGLRLVSYSGNVGYGTATLYRRKRSA